MKTTILILLALFLSLIADADTTVSIQDEIAKENRLRTDVQLCEVSTERNGGETIIWLSLENYTETFILYDAKLWVIRGHPVMESVGAKITINLDSIKIPSDTDAYSAAIYTILLDNYKSKKRYQNSIVVRLNDSVIKNLINDKNFNDGFYIEIPYRGQDGKIQWVKSDLIKTAKKGWGGRP